MIIIIIFLIEVNRFQTPKLQQIHFVVNHCFKDIKTMLLFKLKTNKHVHSTAVSCKYKILHLLTDFKVHLNCSVQSETPANWPKKRRENCCIFCCLSVGLCVC